MSTSEPQVQALLPNLSNLISLIKNLSNYADLSQLPILISAIKKLSTDHKSIPVNYDVVIDDVIAVLKAVDLVSKDPTIDSIDNTLIGILESDTVRQVLIAILKNIGPKEVETDTIEQLFGVNHAIALPNFANIIAIIQLIMKLLEAFAPKSES